MTIYDEINSIITHEGQPVPHDLLERAMREVPYYLVPMLLYLERTPDAPDRDDILARLAIAHPDRSALATQLGEGMETLAHFYPDEALPHTPDTDTTIDRFLSNYGTTSEKEIAALEQAIFNPMPDYADVLAAQEREQGKPSPDNAEDEQDALINSFIAQSMEQQRQATDTAQHPIVSEQEKQEIAAAEVQNPNVADDTMLSQSLAKMYISRKKYSQALEIIENISLKFPEKSIYFADQIRFLRKLVLIEQRKNN